MTRLVNLSSLEAMFSTADLNINPRRINEAEEQFSLFAKGPYEYDGTVKEHSILLRPDV